MKVYTIGETVLDIIFKNNHPVSARPGGSVLNASVSLGRLGADVHFISDYGRDEVGGLIDDFLRKNHVNTDHVVKFDHHLSALALAFLNEQNDASYTFYKDFPAKRLQDISVNFTDKDYLLFGSFFAITESVRAGLLKLLRAANQAGTTIIYDPNFRKPHLHELEKVKPWIIENMNYADIIKGSDEDFNLIFQAANADDAYHHVLEAGCRNMVYTAGPDDVILKAPGVMIREKVPAIQPVSTIGAGDNFNAGILYSLWKERYSRKDLEHFPANIWQGIIQNGIAFASNVCLHYDNYISEDFASDCLSF